ncbi:MULTISPECIES: hypothetical protein [unclassified Leucobacter]|uniref:hypothetical protein n=1 Tax=unclassified Leucobacter TaxID=2621730 RepID=UPI0030178FD6
MQLKHRVVATVFVLAGLTASWYIAQSTNFDKGGSAPEPPKYTPEVVETDGYDIREESVTLSDGTTVICLHWTSVSRADPRLVSCDWPGADRPNAATTGEVKP